MNITTEVSKSLTRNRWFSRILNLFPILAVIPAVISYLALSGKLPSEEGLPWFLVALAMLAFPLVAKIKFGDFELALRKIANVSESMEELSTKMTKLAPRRFANLVYLISADEKLALIYRENYSKYLPMGKRLDYHEAPDQAVFTTIEEQSGIEADMIRFWPPASTEEFQEIGGHTALAQMPFQVQKEVHDGHRDEINEHYDFVYVCLISHAVEMTGKNDPNDDKKPSWYNREQVEKMHERGKTFSDVYPTFLKILAAIRDSKTDTPVADIRENISE